MERNEEKYKEFYKHCLLICYILIIDTIKSYKLDLSGNVTIKSEKERLQAAQLSSLLHSIHYREEQIKRVLSNEVTNFLAALTEGGSMYH